MSQSHQGQTRFLIGGNYLFFAKTTDAIRASQREGSSLGISGTPSFVAGLTDVGDLDQVRVTQFIRGAQPLTAFQNAIDSLLKEAEEARTGAGD